MLPQEYLESDHSPLRREATNGMLAQGNALGFVRVEFARPVRAGGRVSQTHSDLLVHVVFSTKTREPAIKSEMQTDLNAYLAGIVRDLEGYPILFNGMPDHVHGLISLRPTHSMAKVMQEIKAGSSRWIHEHRKVKSFMWQSGYGAFSVSRSQVPAVAEYIRNQQEHHRKIDFKQEYILLLKKHGVEYDERYIWT